MVIDDLKRDYTDEQLVADGKAGSMVGLYSPGMDLKAEIGQAAQEPDRGILRSA